MKYERFEQLPVWQESAKLAAELFVFCAKPIFRGKGDLANQLQRAALSISNNIAEGFERGTTKELISFLYYARGSAGEVRSMLALLEFLSEAASYKQEIQQHRNTVESITRQIRGWAQSLQDSPIKGQKFLTKQSKEEQQREKSRQAFLEQLEELTKKSRGF